MSSDLAVLGVAVRTARQWAGLTIEEAARRGGLSPVTWARVEKGAAVRGLTYAAIERALGWASGAVDAVLAGAEPVIDAFMTPGGDPLIEEIWANPDLTEGQKLHLDQLVRSTNAQLEAVRQTVRERLRRTGDHLA
jgi:transcriptional regulator with XRE-family HTH domain